MQKTIQQLIDQDYKDYSKYVVKNRALPSNVDGLKPVQRKILFSMLQTNGKKKVAEIGSGLSSYNYHHGEKSAQDAVSKMGQSWSNNIPLLKGHGNFGSVMVHEPAASRYIYAELSTIVPYIFKDTDLAPKSSDIEDPEPEYFLPIIPFQLVNGIQGIAVGFATNIMPHDPKSIVKACRVALRGKAMEPIVSWPSFSGEILTDGSGKYVFNGIVEEQGAFGYLIKELPVGYDRLKYVANLEKLLERDVISDYSDDCSKEGFRFKIKVSRAQRDAFKKKGVLESLKLQTSETQNIVMVNHMALDNTFVYIPESVSKYIEDFVQFRLGFYEIRIKRDISIMEERINFLRSKERLIESFIADSKKYVVAFSKSKQESKAALIGLGYPDSHIERLVSIPLYSLSTENLQQLKADISKHLLELESLKKLDQKNLYDKELEDLSKKL